MTATNYRGWTITFDYGRYHATGPNYDCDYRGEEDGYVSNGEWAEARTLEGLREEIDARLEVPVPCKRCGTPAMALNGPLGWAVECNNDGTLGDDVTPCRAAGPTKATEAAATSAWNVEHAPHGDAP